ncbi:MAG: hypothetical protein R3E68_04400 [Burkholderiaceae bacterium]
MPAPLYQSLEPPGGDFVKYVESIVGPSLAQDPQIIAQAVSARLREQSERNHAIMNALDSLPRQASASEVRAAADAARTASLSGPLDHTQQPSTHAWGAGQPATPAAPAIARVAAATGTLPEPADVRAAPALRALLGTAATGMGLLGLALVGIAVFLPAPWSEPLLLPGIILGVFGFIIRRAGTT